MNLDTKCFYFLSSWALLSFTREEVTIHLYLYKVERYKCNLFLRYLYYSIKAEMRWHSILSFCTGFCKSFKKTSYSMYHHFQVFFYLELSLFLNRDRVGSNSHFRFSYNWIEPILFCPMQPVQTIPASRWISQKR